MKVIDLAEGTVTDLGELAGGAELSGLSGVALVHNVVTWEAWPVALQVMRFALVRLLAEHPGTWVVAEPDWDQWTH